MSQVPKSEWTDLERELDMLVRRSESLNQLVRIAARMDLDKFIRKHGKDKCDQMWERIK